MSTPPLLVARQVSKQVRDGDTVTAILQGIDLEIGAGERVALVGPSGSGKSTLLQILGALDPHYEGTVQVTDATLSSLSDAQLAHFRGHTFGFVFQSYNLLGHLSALENVLLPAYFSAHAPQPARAAALLEQVGLAGKAHRRPGALSGGERQRVAIARALYPAPRIIFADEPTGNLDSGTAADILALFAQLSGEGVTLVIATHDDAIANNAHRVLRLQGGRLQSAGAP